MAHEQASAEVSDALRAAKHWRMYREAVVRAEKAETEALSLHMAVGYEKGRADAAERALADERAKVARGDSERARAWEEGWTAAQAVVDLDGMEVWAHAVFPDECRGNPYRAPLRGAQ